MRNEGAREGGKKSSEHGINLFSAGELVAPAENSFFMP